MFFLQFFLPPTFESDVITSTPNGLKITEKRPDSPLEDKDEECSQLKQPERIKPNIHKPSTSFLSPNTTPPTKRRRTSGNPVIPLSQGKLSASGGEASGLLTPCSDDYAASRSVSRPQTQEQQNPFISSGSANPVNDTGPAETPSEQLSELGNARGLPVPRTPERNKLPTMNELLATSRRSKTRPRPQLRRSQAGEKHAAGHADSQATNQYGSSPTSGNLISPSSLRYIAQSSPLSPIFTQNPSQFAPPFTSTQPAVDGSPRLSGKSSLRPKFVGIPRTGSAKSHLTSQNFVRSSSNLTGMVYNSQLNVEERVDGVMDFIHRDLNLYTHLMSPSPGLEDEELSS